MKFILTLAIVLGSLNAQEVKRPVSPANQIPANDSEPIEIPVTPDIPKLRPAEDPEKLFQKGFELGRVGDRPTGSYRRLIQRTVMIGEPQQNHGAILTFDDQIIPTDRGHSSAMDIAKDLQLRGVRAIFFTTSRPSLKNLSMPSSGGPRIVINKKTRSSSSSIHSASPSSKASVT